MAFDAFLKLDGIPGESIDAKHKGEIAVLSFSFGVTRPADVHVGGGGAAGAKPQFQDFFFAASTQISTPKLLQACASGEHFKQAILTVRKAGGAQQEYFKVTLSDVVVSSFQTGGSPQGDAPADSVGLNFAKIQVQYSPTTPKGTLGPPVTGGWDLKKNVKI